MKISRQKLRLIIENLFFENKANYEPKENWPAKRKKAEKDALYGDPEKRKDLKNALKKKWKGKVPLCKTCSAYDTSAAARKAGAKKGTGYCHFLDFACKETNSCKGWAPIKGKK